MVQLNLLPDRRPSFDGNPFDAALDAERLGRQLETVRTFMRLQCGWVTLLEIERATGVLTASAGARLRDLRKPKFGGWTVERRRRVGAPGTFEYRLLSPGVEAA